MSEVQDDGTGKSDKMGASGNIAMTTSGVVAGEGTNTKQQNVEKIQEDDNDGEEGADVDKSKKKKKKKTGSVDPKLNSLIKIYGF